jgi:hypothetical protein
MGMILIFLSKIPGMVLPQLETQYGIFMSRRYLALFANRRKQVFIFSYWLTCEKFPLYTLRVTMDIVRWTS